MNKKEKLKYDRLIEGMRSDLRSASQEYFDLMGHHHGEITIEASKPEDDAVALMFTKVIRKLTTPDNKGKRNEL